MKGVFMGEEIKNKNAGFENKRPYPLLDKTIKDPHERNEIVHKIVAEVPPEKLTPYYLE
jgi:hypothetical protein